MLIVRPDQPPNGGMSASHVFPASMANSLVIQGAIFAVGALVGGGIATAVARKNHTVSPQSVTLPQQPILHVGTTGDTLIAPNAGVVCPPLKHGNPGTYVPLFSEELFPMSVVRPSHRPTHSQSVCGRL